ncbi:hypothetical protein BGZ51_002650 [Haplosporangium sp. Z 767]|nr:hypothetical protein BGZ51_002650 [Haplosporangium sp. Z 767]
MELHTLLGQHPGSPSIESLLKDATIAAAGAKTPGVLGSIAPTIKVYKDAVYYSYLPLGISFNYEPSIPLVPSAYTATSATAPDPGLLKLVAIHLYRHPADKFETFPLSIRIRKQESGGATTTMTVLNLDMDMKAYEVVQMFGEPEEKQGGGRQGNCWIGYQKSAGLSVDFVGSSWEDREMAMSCLTLTSPGSSLSLFGLYALFLRTTNNLSPSKDHVMLNGEGEPMDITLNGPSSDKSVSESPIVRLEKKIQRLIDTNRIMVFSKSYCPFSAAAKELLKSYTNDFKVMEVDHEDESDNIKKVLTKIAHGHSTFPSIFFVGESIGGKDKLQALEDKGELKSRLESLGVAMVQ